MSVPLCSDAALLRDGRGLGSHPSDFSLEEDEVLFPGLRCDSFHDGNVWEEAGLQMAAQASRPLLEVGRALGRGALRCVHLADGTRQLLPVSPQLLLSTLATEEPSVAGAVKPTNQVFPMKQAGTTEVHVLEIIRG